MHTACQAYHMHISCHRHRLDCPRVGGPEALSVARPHTSRSDLIEILCKSNLRSWTSFLRSRGSTWNSCTGWHWCGRLPGWMGCDAETCWGRGGYANAVGSRITGGYPGQLIHIVAAGNHRCVLSSAGRSFDSSMSPGRGFGSTPTGCRVLPLSPRYWHSAGVPGRLLDRGRRGAGRAQRSRRADGGSTIGGRGVEMNNAITTPRSREFHVVGAPTSVERSLPMRRP